MKLSETKEDLIMGILALVFSIFLSVIAVVVCIRVGKLLVKAINKWFNKIEDKIS